MVPKLVPIRKVTALQELREAVDAINVNNGEGQVERAFRRVATTAVCFCTPLYLNVSRLLTHVFARLRTTVKIPIS